MSANKCYRRLVGVACLTVLLFAAALGRSLLVDRLLSGQPNNNQGEILACLFGSTRADWPSHAVNYGLAGVLLMGTLSGMGSLLRQWYQTRLMMQRLLQFARPSDDRRWDQLVARMNLQGRVDFVDIDASIAFCYGLLRPRICVSTGAIAGLTRREVEALLLHERYHLLQHDPLKTAISRALANMFFFLPVVRALARVYAVTKEIEADKYVLKRQESDQPLLGALYKLLQRGKVSTPASVAMVGAVDSINGRLDYLLKGRTPSLHFSTVLTSFVVVVGIGTVTALTTWASAASTLWYQAHSSFCGC